MREMQSSEIRGTLADEGVLELAIVANCEYSDVTFFVQSCGALAFDVTMLYADQAVLTESISAQPWLVSFVPPDGPQEPGKAPVVFPASVVRPRDGGDKQGFQVSLQVENTGGAPGDFVIWATWRTAAAGAG